MVLIAGADEAGRGCVIGPLVLCIAYCKKEDEQKLKKMGAKDSKELSPSRREELKPMIEKICKFSLISITARELNELMNTYSLNEIEAMKIGEALTSLEKDKISAIYVDSPDTVKERFTKRITKYYKGSAKIVSDHKADAKYPIVSAASILAKTARDSAIESIKKELNYDFNSGYTSDP
ncbi:MAG: ribonuclease HII, partial [Candidatus Micrarchaeota archaeon]